jgi:hypothetical protein
MTISYRAGTNTAANAAVATLTPAVPTGVTSTDISILSVELKQTTAGTAPSITGGTTGWTALGTVVNTGNNLTTGVDTGTNYLWLYYRIGTYTAPSVTTSGADTGGASITAYATSIGTWETPTATTGVDSTNGADGSITGGANLSIATGDWLFCASAHPGDVGTMSAQTIAATGATLGATTNVRINLGVTTSSDSRLMVMDRNVTAGTSSAAPTLVWTNASNLTGVAAFVRLREQTTTTHQGDVSLTVNTTITVGVTGQTHPSAVSLTASLTATVGVTSQTHLPTVSLTVTPTVTVSAVRVVLPTVSLTAVPTSTIGAVQINWGAVNLTVTPSITITEPLRTLFGVVTLSVDGTFSAAAGQTHVTVVSLSVSSTFTSDATVNKISTVSLSATSTISVNASRIAVSSVSLLASPTLTATDSSFAIFEGALSLIVESTILASATRVVLANVALNVSAIISGDGSRTAVSAVGLSVVPSLNAGGMTVKIGDVSFIISPTITVVGQRFAVSAFSLFVDSIFSADGAALKFGSISLTAMSDILVAFFVVDVVRPIEFADEEWKWYSSKLYPGPDTYPGLDTYPTSNGGWSFDGEGWTTLDSEGEWETLGVSFKS